MILDNPNKMLEIIESNKFNDRTNFNLHGRAYIENIQYLTSEDKSKVKVDGFGKPSIPYYKKYTNEYEMIKDAKVIYVKKEGMPYILYFMFREYNEKSILVGLNIGYI